MSNSIRLNKLFSRIKLIEKNLLPRIKISGNYTKKECDLIRSYVLLVHAEIESYFEDIAAEKVKKALEGWSASRKKSNCLLSIMAFCPMDSTFEKDANTKTNKLDFRVHKTVNYYLAQLEKNHGIKEQNLLDILLPLGIEINRIDATWLTTMDDFGKRRGFFAHTASSVHSIIDLATEQNSINLILPEIANIDLMIKKLN